ncbi:MAG TPA: lanthionine synthetase LanC family protein [Gemmatimonadales bacterium]
MLPRRHFLIAALAAPPLAEIVRKLGLTDRPWLDAALKAEKWIRRSRQTTGSGIAWPADPLRPDSVSPDLYNGMPGVVLFYLELFKTTGQNHFLHEAELGARQLASRLPQSAGLYTGLAGTAFVLERTATIGGRSEFTHASLRCTALLLDQATAEGDGVQWNDTTDIIAGSAGIGLTLLMLEPSLGGPRARELAVLAGRRLLELGTPAEGGLTWMMNPTFPRNMPNFSHGTAGVAYFLARLHALTGEAMFLDGAKAGARYLQAIAAPKGAGVVIRHHDGDGEQLFYLSWCHGPAGTARLFHQLALVDPGFRPWVARLARGIPALGVPRRSDGFWNNISQCCGNAGVVQFALDRARTHRDPGALEFARQVTADLMQRATPDRDGLKWVQAEHRVQPENLVAQTGFMQGAAGVGTVLLHLDAAERGDDWSITFPDSPF